MPKKLKQRLYISDDLHWELKRIAVDRREPLQNLAADILESWIRAYKEQERLDKESKLEI